MSETCFNYTSGPDKMAWFSSDERKWINKMRRLAEQNPDDVTILKQPDENDGCIYVQLPAEYLKISPKRRVTLSDEQLALLRERGKSMQKHKDNP